MLELDFGGGQLPLPAVVGPGALPHGDLGVSPSVDEKFTLQERTGWPVALVSDGPDGMCDGVYDYDYDYDKIGICGWDEVGAGANIPASEITPPELRHTAASVAAELLAQLADNTHRASLARGS